ncbi:hypothetical protein REPUB_Repub12eG0049200 [Reevesia pubescens]
MLSAIGTLMVDVFATSRFTKPHSNKMQQIDGDEEKAGKDENHVHVHTHASHGHSHGSISFVEGSGSIELLRHRVISQVMELGIVVHSVIIGISLGDSQSPKTMKYKAFGGFGIAIGIGISNIYNESSPNALIVEGIFNSASDGILIYMALVDLLADDFMRPKLQNNGMLQIGVNVSLLLGAGLMSLLAIWA